MANSQAALFNFYRRYKWGSVAFTEWQQGMIDYARAIQEGMFGGAILQGGAIAPSGMGVSVLPLIATGPTGNLMVVDSIQVLPITAPSATNRRDYIVVRPLLENSNYITSPTDPNATVPLKVLQKAQVVQIAGTIGASPAYPSLQPNDVIIGGVSVKNGQVSIATVDIDLEVRDIVGKKSSIQQNAGKYDDRLRPYRSTNQLMGIKPSQLDSPQARAFSYVNKWIPSIFPRASALYVHADTFLNFQTGAITGADTTSTAFTPTIPTSGNAIVAAVALTPSDTLVVTYGTLGTRQQCYDGIKNQIGSGAGCVVQSANNKPIAFVIVQSSNGSAVTDLDVVDARSLASFGNSGVGSSGVVTPGAYPVTLVAANTGQVVLVDTASARTVTLPAHAAGLIFTVKDATGASTNGLGSNLNAITIARNGGTGKIDNVSADLVVRKFYGSYSLISNGTDWFSIGKDEDYQEGTFTATFVGMTNATATAKYIKRGNQVTLSLAASGVSDLTTCTITGYPTHILPASLIQDFAVQVRDNGVYEIQALRIAPGAWVMMRTGSITGWTASGTKALINATITYSLL